jgi:hypothetical protein
MELPASEFYCYYRTHLSSNFFSYVYIFSQTRIELCFRYESNENMTLACSTKVCSFGKQVVEKVEKEYARFENGRFMYRIPRSPMCEYMINFIHKLKHLPEKYMMNSVLENFTILQVRFLILYGLHCALTKHVCKLNYKKISDNFPVSCRAHLKFSLQFIEEAAFCMTSSVKLSLVKAIVVGFYQTFVV